MISLKDFAEEADPLIYGTVLNVASKSSPQGYIHANGKTLDDFPENLGNAEQRVHVVLDRL